MAFLEFLRKRYRSKDLIKRITSKIHEVWGKLSSNLEELRIMTFCGTHEHTVVQFGLRQLLPKGVRLIPGPGCPVCCTPSRDIDEAIKLSLEGIRVYTYGDVYRAPGSKMSLQDAKAEGGDVKVVYSFTDALKDAKMNGKESVFFAVGFETTVPTFAPYAIKEAIPKNLKVLMSYRLTPPVMRYVLSLEYYMPDYSPLGGVIAPGHVSTIIGVKPWVFVADEFQLPIVVAGFEPLDVMLAVHEVLLQNLLGEARIVNEYARVVRWEGNVLAQKYINEVFTVSRGVWRGMGEIPSSVYAFRDKYSWIDARNEYGIRVKESIDYKPGCRCAEVTIGKIYPIDCPMFLKTCTPSRPLGPCMVSLEGTCFIWAKYGGRNE